MKDAVTNQRMPWECGTWSLVILKQVQGNLWLGYWKTNIHIIYSPPWQGSGAPATQ